MVRHYRGVTTTERIAGESFPKTNQLTTNYLILHIVNEYSRIINGFFP